MNIKFFESIAKEIEGKFRRISHILQKANLKSGEYHEEILRSTLGNFLSARFSVKTGYIWLNDEKQSKQIDILIIDENCPFGYLFKEKDFAIVRPEAVVAVIEVKTVLKYEQLVEGFENIYSAKSLKKEALGHYGHILGIVFGYESNKTIDNQLLDKWFKSEEIAKFEKEVAALWPDVLFFFQNNTYLLKDQNALKRNTNKEYYYRLYKDRQRNLKAWQLSLMIAAILTACENEVNVSQNIVSIKPYKSTQLLDFEGAMQGVDGFRPKEGHALVAFKKE